MILIAFKAKILSSNKQGGFLATITDQAEQDRIYSLMQEYNGVTSIWIGLTDRGHPNYYEKWENTDEPVSVA